MARYHLDWEIVEERMPSTPQEVATGWNMLIGLVKQDIEKGTMKEWGAYPGERTGYTVAEGTNADIVAMTTMYAPYVRFSVRPIMTVEEVEGVLKSMT